jgi:hypothetical protein
MRIRLLALLLVAALLLACSSKRGSTQLWEDLQSNATVESVKGRLRNTLPKDGWTQKVDQVPAEKGRPAYQFVTLVGPRESYGVAGELTLTFYNDRLMSTSFKANCEEYMGALRGRGVNIPDAASHEVTLDRRTRFRYDQQGTNCRFLWVDPNLEREWMDSSQGR